MGAAVTIPKMDHSAAEPRHSTCSFVDIVGNASDRQSIEVGRHSGVREYFCRLRQDLLVGIAARDVRKDESLHAGGRGKLGRFRRGEMAVFEGHGGIAFEK